MSDSEKKICVRCGEEFVPPVGVEDEETNVCVSCADDLREEVDASLH